MSITNEYEPPHEAVTDMTEEEVVAKIEAALEESRDRSKMISDAEVWKRLGLEP